MIYYSIQNVLAIGKKGRKIEDQVNQIVPFYQDDLVKDKMTSTLKVSGVMINARDRLILLTVQFCFLRNLSQWLKITAFCSSGFITIIA